ncbi:MAG: hypothetical protein CMJ18_19130, partial [Phycisphaeraceae bacterium]|nr:hypothetical protein [Phycisphaeraceae bacterium]
MTDATIHSACARGDIDRVRGLIAADPAVVDADDEHQWRPIFHAALWRHVDVVRLLIESGADISAHDGYVLHYGAEVPDNKAIVTMLVQHGALEAHVRPTSDLSRQFLVALYFGQTQRVKAMLSRHPHLATETDGIG